MIWKKNDILDELFMKGKVPPEAVDELSYGKDPDHDYKQSDELYEDLPEHVGDQDCAGR